MLAQSLKEGLNGSSQLREITLLSAKTNQEDYDRHRIRVRFWSHKRVVRFSIGTLDEQNPSAVGMGPNSVVSEIFTFCVSYFHIYPCIYYIYTYYIYNYCNYMNCLTLLFADFV